VLPIAEQAHLGFAAYVETVGEANLPYAEAIVWSIISTPLGPSRLRLIALGSVLPEDTAKAIERTRAVQDIVQQLRESKPLKMFLQSILLVRSVLSQKEHRSFSIKELGPTLKFERYRRVVVGGSKSKDGVWYEENVPTTLRLVAEILADNYTDAAHGRFMQLVAVSRATPMMSLRQQIWSYIGPCGSCVCDALPLLAGCDPGLFEREMYGWLRSKAAALSTVLIQDVAALERHFALVPGLADDFSQCLPQVREGVREAQSIMSAAMEAMGKCAEELCQMLGEHAGERERRLENAEVCMRQLQVLGTCVSKEVESLLMAKRKQRQLHIQSSFHDLARRIPAARNWRTVDTRYEVLQATVDPNMVRALRATFQDQYTNDEEEEERRLRALRQRQSPPVVHGVEETLAAHARASARDLWSPGVEGFYVRDPATGTWGRRREASSWPMD